MILKVRQSEENEWGYVESFEVYSYKGEGFISVITGISVTEDGVGLTQPYIMRGNQFIPLDVIDEEMGIDKYIKSKKPFYSKIEDGFVVKLKVRCIFDTGEYIPEKSVLDVYTPACEEMGIRNGELFLRKILNTSEEFKSLLSSLAEDVAKCRGDREVFLRSRCSSGVLDPNEVLDI